MTATPAIPMSLFPFRAANMKSYLAMTVSAIAQKRYGRYGRPLCERRTVHFPKVPGGWR